MTHHEKVARWLAPLEAAGGLGVEVGAFRSPIPGIRPFYVDCFTQFGNEACTADYYGHACSLPFRDNSLDYVVTSHVLEHVANPVAAFAEWNRVLRPGGIVYLVVPDRRFTWDRTRELTPAAHMLDDYARNTTACDATHVGDFAQNMDWSLFDPACPAAELPAKKAALEQSLRHAVSTGNDVNIHFHVFEPSNLSALIASLPPPFHWEIVDRAEKFPAENPIGFLLVIRVSKTLKDRIEAWKLHRVARKNKNAVLLPSAEKFSDFVRTCVGIGGVK